MEYILQTNSLVKTYGKQNALDGLNMNIEKGSIYGFVGKNGAGKTTLIRLICGLQNPTQGGFTLLGRKNDSREIYKARKKMGAVIERPAFYSDLSAKENLRMQNTMLGVPADEGVDELLQFVGLGDTGKKKAGRFSLGMRQRLGIAIALCGNPEFIVLDEPINGIDPQGIIEIREIIHKINKDRGVTILISSHILDELARLATHYGFIDKGRIVQEISAADLEARCRKYSKIEVNNMTALIKILDAQGLEYEKLSDNIANVYGKVNVTKLVKDLSDEGAELISINEYDESLENYYINLVGSEADRK